LRGQLAVLDAVVRLLGESLVPKSINAALAIQRDRDATPSRRLESAVAIQENWLDFVGEVSKTQGLSENVRRQALVRLLGLYHTVNAAASERSGGMLTAEVSVVGTLKLPALAAAAGEMNLTTKAPWSLDGQGAWRFSGFPEAIPLVMRTSLVCDDVLRSGLLGLGITIRNGQESAMVQFEEALLPSINSWWIVGPFENPRKQALDKVFPPEREVDFDAGYRGKDGKEIHWKQLQRKLGPGADLRGEFVVNFQKVFDGQYEDVVAYALTHIEAPQDMAAVLAIGSDDRVAAWLNSTEVHRTKVPRPYRMKEDRIPIKLMKGTNTLLVKVQQGGGDWALGVHVEDADGKPLPQVRVGSGPGKIDGSDAGQPK
jgi:hypothetical protein